MTLIRQDVDVRLTGGLETRTDRKLVVPGQLLDLENAVFRGGTIARRDGSLPEVDAVSGGGSLTEARALAAFRNTLLRSTSTSVQALMASSSTWTSVGSTTPAAVERTQVVRDLNTQTECDVLRVGAYTLYAFADAPGTGSARTATLQVVDNATGTVVLAKRALGGPGTAIQTPQPRLLDVGGGNVLILWLEFTGIASFIRRALWSSSNPGTITYPGTGPNIGNVISGVGLFNFDAVANPDGTVGVLYTDSAVPPQARMVVLSSVGAVTIGSTTVGTNGGAGRVALVSFASGQYGCLYKATATGSTLLSVHGSTLAPVLSNLSLGTAASAVDCYAVGSLDGGVTWRVLVQNSSTYVEKATFTAAGVTATATRWAYRLRLAGDLFAQDGKLYVPAAYYSTGTYPGHAVLQPTGFVVEYDNPGTVLARVLPLVTGYGPEEGRLPRPVRIDATTVGLVYPERGKSFSATRASVAQDLTPVGLSLVRLSFVQPGTLSRLELEGGTYYAGACPTYYDGNGLVEAGFHVTPEIKSVVLAGNAAGGLSAGVYSWVACYEWVNAQGEIERSAPSAPFTLTVAAGDFFWVTVTRSPLGRRFSPRSVAGVVLYRTRANGTNNVFFRHSGVPSEHLNSSTAETVEISDARTDANLIGSEVLYTSGGILEYFPPPAHRFAHLHAGYVFVGGLEDPYSYAYSLPQVAGAALAFSPRLAGRLPPETGKLTGFATLDGALLLFTERAVYVMTGTGPTSTGADNGFSEPSPITGAPGCVDWRAVAALPEGVLYKAPTGFRMISRGFAAEDAGGGAHRYNALTVVASVVVDAAEEARFYTAESTTLIYSYRWRQWSTFTAQPAADAAELLGKVYRANGTRLFYDSATTFLEEGTTVVPVKVGTSWLRFSTIQGAQRVWWVYVLGSFTGSGLRVTSQVYYNYDEATPVDVRSDTFSASGVLQFRQGLTKQTCQALRFVWTFDPSTTGPVADFASVGLSALTLSVGIQPGAARLPRSKTL